MNLREHNSSDDLNSYYKQYRPDGQWTPKDAASNPQLHDRSLSPPNSMEEAGSPTSNSPGIDEMNEPGPTQANNGDGRIEEPSGKRMVTVGKLRPKTQSTTPHKQLSGAEYGSHIASTSEQDGKDVIQGTMDKMNNEGERTKIQARWLAPGERPREGWILGRITLGKPTAVLDDEPK